MEWIVVLTAFVLLLVGKAIMDEVNRKKKLRVKVMNSFGRPPKEDKDTKRFQYIDAYLKSLPERETDIDEITWNDLDMDRIFTMLNGTYSAVGEEYLYAALHRPETEEKALSELEDRIRYFSENEEKRTNYSLAFLRMGKLRSISVYKYLMRLSDVPKESNYVHYSPLVLYIIGIAMFIYGMLGHDGVIGPSVLLVIGTAFYNVFMYIKRKGQIGPYLQVLSYTVRWLENLKFLSSVDDHEDLAKLQSLYQPFSGIGRGMRWLAPPSVTGDLLDMLMDYIRMLTHIDLIKFNRMNATLIKYRPEIHEMFGICGRLDMAISIASYRAYVDEYCVPELSFDPSKDSPLTAENLGHPLITEPVRNSLTTAGPILLTGSNASGKSTFLRSVALAAIMAQTVHTVNASRYAAKAYHIVSSMSLADDLLAGESYYIVEIKSIKRILDMGDKEIPVLCFVDEVLRGTNTAERIAASSEILSYMAKKGMTAFAATHDIELTSLLEKEYTNYHFSETVTEGDIHFDYLLKPGRATSKNAIALLHVMDYPEEITEKASGKVEHFLTKGDWQC